MPPQVIMYIEHALSCHMLRGWVLPCRLPRELRMRNANATSDIGEDRAGRVKQTCLKIRRALMLQVSMHRLLLLVSSTAATWDTAYSVRAAPCCCATLSEFTQP